MLLACERKRCTLDQVLATFYKKLLTSSRTRNWHKSFLHRYELENNMASLRLWHCGHRCFGLGNSWKRREYRHLKGFKEISNGCYMCQSPRKVSLNISCLKNYWEPRNLLHQTRNVRCIEWHSEGTQPSLAKLVLQCYSKPLLVVDQHT